MHWLRRQIAFNASNSGSDTRGGRCSKVSHDRFRRIAQTTRGRFAVAETGWRLVHWYVAPGARYRAQQNDSSRTNTASGNGNSTKRPPDISVLPNQHPKKQCRDWPTIDRKKNALRCNLEWRRYAAAKSKWKDGKAISNRSLMMRGSFWNARGNLMTNQATRDIVRMLVPNASNSGRVISALL